MDIFGYCVENHGGGGGKSRGSYEANAIIQEKCRWLGARWQLRRWWDEVGSWIHFDRKY